MSYGYNNNPYSQGPAAEGGYGHGQDQQYGGGQYEMQPYGQQPQQGQGQGGYGGGHGGDGPRVASVQDYLDRVQYLRGEVNGLTSDMQRISTLHQRALASSDASSNDELNQAVSQTQLRNTAITEEIKSLERDAANTPQGDPARATKQNHVKSVKDTFKRELQSYMRMEQDYQRRYEEQIARQYRIVNPDASEEEVRQATDADWGNEGVFQTALKSNRTGQANSVLGNVRARHSELQRIERTLAEVAQLFNEMAVIVEQQEPVVQAAEENATQTVENLDKGNDQVEVANKHARNRRKLKWWCLLVVVLIILAIALGVGLGVGLVQSQTGGN